MKVTLIEYTPDPDKVCDIAARNCVSQNIPETESKDFKSLVIALKSGHTSVAEHAVFTFGIEGISRVCSHQLVRHRLASYAQQSQRYVKMEGFDYSVPDSITQDEKICKQYHKMIQEIANTYYKMIQAGIPEEDARYVLPNACHTNIVVTMNGRELLNFFTLRCCNKAQQEIQELALEMLKLVKPIAPVLFEDAGPNCMHDCGCQEMRPCNRDLPMGAHTMKRGNHE